VLGLDFCFIVNVDSHFYSEVIAVTLAIEFIYI